MIALICDTIPESLNVIFSPIWNTLSFSYTKFTCCPPGTVTTRPTAPEVAPTNCSPTTTLFVNVSV